MPRWTDRATAKESAKDPLHYRTNNWFRVGSTGDGGHLAYDHNQRASLDIAERKSRNTPTYFVPRVSLADNALGPDDLFIRSKVYAFADDRICCYTTLLAAKTESRGSDGRATAWSTGLNSG